MNAVAPQSRHYLIAMREQVVALDLSEMIKLGDSQAITTIAPTTQDALAVLLHGPVRAVFIDIGVLRQPRATELVAMAATRSTLIRLGGGALPAGLVMPRGPKIDLPFTEAVIAAILSSIRPA